jgi:CheY-like chemotaxis protein
LRVLYALHGGQTNVPLLSLPHSLDERESIKYLYSMKALIIDSEHSFSKAIRNAVEQNIEGLEVYALASLDGMIEAFTEQVRVAEHRGQEDSAAVVSRTAIDVLIVAWELLGSDPIDGLKKLVEKLKLFNGEQTFITLLSAYEHPGFQMRPILSSEAVDVLFKPFDELLFLQKLMHLIPSLRPKSKGNFLYTSRKAFKLELAGEYTVAGVSDGGIQVKSRLPLPRMKKLKMYSSLFQDVAKEGLHGYAFAGREVDNGAAHASDFAFFGLSAPQIKFFRDLQAPHRKALQSAEAGKGKKAAEDAKIQQLIDILEGKKDNGPKEKLILMADADTDTESALNQMIGTDTDTTKLLAFQSFQAMMHALDPNWAAGTNGKLDEDLPKWSTEEAFHEGTTFIINPSGWSLLEVRNLKVSHDRFLGEPAKSLLGPGDNYWRTFYVPERNEVREFFKFILTGQTATLQVRMINSKGTLYWVLLKGKMDKSGIAVELVDQTKTAVEAAMPVFPDRKETMKLSNTVAVVIDYAFIKAQPDPLLERLIRALHGITARTTTPIFLLNSEGGVAALLEENKLNVHDVFFKPIDRGYFIRKVRQSIAFALGESEQLFVENYVPAEGWLDIAKTITADSIGEYGIEFTHQTRVPEGAWGYFYHPDLKTDKGRGMLGRCVRVTKKEQKFRMSFVFLGIREDVLKQIRLFIKKFSLEEKKN